MQTNTEPNVAGHLLRTLFQSRLLIGYIEDLPDEMQDKKLLGYLYAHAEHIQKQIEPGTYPWLEKETNIQWDIGAMADLMQRLSVEVKQPLYEEMVMLFTKAFNSVFYSQEKRKKLYIPKYKAIFQLIADEIKADTDGVSGTFLHFKGETFINLKTQQDNQTLKP